MHPSHVRSVEHQTTQVQNLVRDAEYLLDKLKEFEGENPNAKTNRSNESCAEGADSSP